MTDLHHAETRHHLKDLHSHPDFICFARIHLEAQPVVKHIRIHAVNFRLSALSC